MDRSAHASPRLSYAVVLLGVIATLAGCGAAHDDARSETAAAVASVGRPAPACAAGSVWDGLECVPKEEPGYAHDGEGDANDARVASRPLAAGDSADEETGGGAAPEDVAYAQALDRYRLHDLTEMRRILFTLIQTYPQSRRVGDAYYWFGVLFFEEARAGDRSRYDLAKVAFEQALRYPQAETAPDNLLKLAMTYDEIGNVASARNTYATLRARFPGSPAARAIPFGH